MKKLSKNNDISIYEKEFTDSFKNLEDKKKKELGEFKLNLLKKHLGFYFGLINGTISPKTNEHLDFIQNTKNKKRTNIHEEAYLDLCDLLGEIRLTKLKQKKEILLNSMEEYPAGLKPYGREVNNSDRHLSTENKEHLN
jgi:hypothetical protein